MVTPETGHPMGFWWEFLSNALDKVLLGGVALGVAFLLNRKLESIRARRALEREFLRERTRRLDEIYTLMLELEATSGKYASEVMKYIRAKKEPINLAMPFKMDAKGAELEALNKKLRNSAARYEPWIGSDIAQLCAAYTTTVRELVGEQTIAGTHDTEKIELLEKKTHDLRSAVGEEIRVAAPERPSRARTR